MSWVRQSLVDHVGPQRAFEGNLNVRTTLDLDLQKTAQKIQECGLVAGKSAPDMSQSGINKTFMMA